MIGHVLKRLRTDPERWAEGPPSLATIADQLGVNKSTVSRWETGDTAPSVAMLAKLLDVLHATPGERVALLRTDEAA